MALPNIQHSVEPSKRETKLAKQSSKTLSRYVESTKTPSFSIVREDGKNQKVYFPASALKLFVNILDQMAEGDTVTLLSVQDEVTTQVAADLLNVSRPYLVKLLDNREIPFRKVGTRRKVLAKDIIDYKTRIDNKRLKTLAALAEQAQKLDMGYK